MNKRIHILSLLIGLFISCTLLAACKKDECVTNSFTLKETWKILPEKDSINVGDTLTFLSQFSNHPFDYNSNKNVDFSSNAIINSTLGVYVLRPGGTNLVAAIDSFKFLSVLGKIETNASLGADHIKQIFYQEANGNYIINFQIIALKKGIYSLGFSDGIATRNKSTNCDDKAGIVFSNNNANNHIYYLKQFYGTTNLPAGESEHGYCFKVK